MLCLITSKPTSWVKSLLIRLSSFKAPFSLFTCSPAETFHVILRKKMNGNLTRDQHMTDGSFPSSRNQTAEPASTNRPQKSPPGAAELPLARKRTAASMTGDDRNPPDPPGQGASFSANTESRSVDPTAQLCLCPPDQKIPRPRNGRYLSFILADPLCLAGTPFFVVSYKSKWLLINH